MMNCELKSSKLKSWGLLWFFGGQGTGDLISGSVLPLVNIHGYKFCKSLSVSRFVDIKLKIEDWW